jgi:hypothetical protein
MKGIKKGQSILLDREPDVPDGTEVEVILPADWEAQRRSLLSVGYHPDFGRDIEESQAADGIQRSPRRMETTPEAEAAAQEMFEEIRRSGKVRLGGWRPTRDEMHERG